MKPVFQTRYGKPEGNCTEACLASMLEIPLEEVPSLYEHCRSPGAESNWFVVLDEFVRTRGFRLVLLEGCPYVREGTLIIVGGPARDNGLPHYVIMRGIGDGILELVHDPHEGWDGITHVEDALLLVPGS